MKSLNISRAELNSLWPGEVQERNPSPFYSTAVDDLQSKHH